MKKKRLNLGKEFSLGTHKNVNITYGTVNYENLKTIYITLECWIDPLEELDYERFFSSIKRKIYLQLYNMNHPFFKKENIVDRDVRTANMKMGKKSFLKIEVTLFVEHQFDIRGKSTRKTITGIAEDIVDLQLVGKIPFDFYTKRK